MTIYANDPRIVSLWRLDEASGTRTDEAGANDLTDNNTVGLSVDRQEGIGSADFNADYGESLTITDAAQVGLDLTPPFSITFWVKFHVTAGSSEGILGKGESDGERQYQVYRRSTTPYPIRFGTSANGSTYTAFTSDTGTNDGTWYHVGIVADGATIVFYRDGAIDSAVPEAWVDAILAGAEGFALGDRAMSAEFFMDGLLDEVAVFDGDLTAAEILSICTEGIVSEEEPSGEPGPCWPRGSYPLDAYPDWYWPASVPVDYVWLAVSAGSVWYRCMMTEVLDTASVATGVGMPNRSYPARSYPDWYWREPGGRVRLALSAFNRWWHGEWIEAV